MRGGGGLTLDDVLTKGGGHMTFDEIRQIMVNTITNTAAVFKFMVVVILAQPVRLVLGEDPAAVPHAARVCTDGYDRCSIRG